VVTSCGPEINLAELLPGVSVCNKATASTTIFRNIYEDGVRRQVLEARAGPVPVIPAGWRYSDIVLLGPLDQEVPASWVGDFPRSLVGLCPQGWLRQWDEEGNITPVVWTEAKQTLALAKAVIISPVDLGGDALLIAEYARWSRVLVVTEGASGASVYYEGQIEHRPAYPAREADPTGAGDVFAAAFVLHLARYDDPARAADFANCVASFAVEAPGLAGVPTWAQVQKRWGR
jgi:hypothetical protein